MSNFDRFADFIEKKVSSAPFFAACCFLILVWLPTYFAFGNTNTWQLVVNTVTTIVTFLLVALLQNTQERFERATNARWCALFEHLGIDDPSDDSGQQGK